MLNLQLRQAFIRLLPNPWRRRFSAETDLEKTSPLINGNGNLNGMNGMDGLSAYPQTSSRPKYGATQVRGSNTHYAPLSEFLSFISLDYFISLITKYSI